MFDRAKALECRHGSADRAYCPQCADEFERAQDELETVNPDDLEDIRERRW